MLYPQSVRRKELPLAQNSWLSSAYHRWFEITPADTPHLQEKAYRLRYQVYCCENNYENPDDHPLGFEIDTFDCRSIHSIITERASGIAAGTVRLIIPDADSQEASLPIQNVSKHPLPNKNPLSNAAEISRFAISRQIRGKIASDCPKDLKCLISLGLMRAIFQMSMRYGITSLYATMAPSLLRLLRRFSIYFTTIGPLVEYHGLRQPCYADVNTLLEGIREEQFALWEFLTIPNGYWAYTNKTVVYEERSASKSSLL